MRQPSKLSWKLMSRPSLHVDIQSRTGGKAGRDASRPAASAPLAKPDGFTSSVPPGFPGQ